MKLLIIGGSGHVSGALARAALAKGHKVWTVTRGKRPLPEGARGLVADRDDEAAFAQAVQSAEEEWDMAVDCICYKPDTMRRALAALRGRARAFVFVSTDFVYDPASRQFPQPEEAGRYCPGGPGSLDYGLNKRLCELALAEGAGRMGWTVVRPCHIYGPPSLLGCLPEHGRDPQLLERLQAGEALRLVGGGHFLQQPILASDLAEMILSISRSPKADGRCFNAAGPDIVESREYYRIVADALGVDLKVEEVPVQEYLTKHPERAPFMCHRIYDLAAARECGLRVPSTPLALGLRAHARALLAQEP